MQRFVFLCLLGLLLAVLLTDTAFYRNHAYHEAGDTLAALDMRRLGLALDALSAY